MRPNLLTQILDRRIAERRFREVSDRLDRRARIPHYRDADIRRTVTIINLGD